MPHAALSEAPTSAPTGAPCVPPADPAGPQPDDILPVWLTPAADGSVEIHLATDPPRSLRLTAEQYTMLRTLIELQR